MAISHEANHLGELFPLLDAWTILQKPMSEVIRWGKYREVFPEGVVF